ncbi:hypothetical protein [Rickettsiales endosymbiont of Stachyamoeba lipophora]|uniref:hypothetical protein n=1 Tax=Rickettsiales endosymbiont of Stachyamoeba lipophora TaxID=2486578 RepID=UPI000F6484D1|nr:hypothetical protein [Rickettsiales endosymbiont of Stachyamoeba lipophora]
MPKFNLQLGSIKSMQKYIFILLSFILSSCQVADPLFNKAGFRVKNYFYNDSNEANKKFNKNYSKDVRRTPKENQKFLAIVDNKETSLHNNTDSTVVYNKKTKHNKASQFWNTVYGDNAKLNNKEPKIDLDITKAPTHKSAEIKAVTIVTETALDLQDKIKQKEVIKEQAGIKTIPALNVKNKTPIITEVKTIEKPTIKEVELKNSLNNKAVVELKDVGYKEQTLVKKLDPSKLTTSNKSKNNPANITIVRHEVKVTQPPAVTKPALKAASAGSDDMDNLDNISLDQIEVLKEVEFLPTNDKNVAKGQNYRYHSKTIKK